MALSLREEAELLELLELEQKEKAKRSLVSFMEYDGQGTWKTAKHLNVLCEKLEAIERKEIKRLMVFMPPRHGKSEVSTKKFPAWFLGRNPNEEVIISSYSADLAYDFSKIARDTLKEHGKNIFGINVPKVPGAVGRWSATEGGRGGLMAAGVGGPITGRGADLAIIDDPFKNWQDAASETVRNTCREWYKSTLRTRLAPGGRIVIVMTRWHEDDLAGWLLEEAKRGGEKWEVVDLPAIADEDYDILGRKQGQYLWTERFSPSEYENTKKAIGSKLWTALYQQKPSPDSGAVFKRYWWRFYLRNAGQMTHETKDCVILPAKFDQEIQSWDCTFKDAATSDFVVGEVWGSKAANRYLLDLVRDRMDLPDTIKAIKNMSTKWPRARKKLIEDKANGPAVIQMLHNQLSGLIAVNPEGGKVVRAMAVTPEIESGNVYLPHPSIAPWILDFIEEASVFPNGKNDDMVDGMTQALTDLQKNKVFNLLSLIS